MATQSISYGTSTPITSTLTGLASSNTTGRGSTPVDNSTDKFVDAMLYLQFKTGAGALANDKAVYVYFYGSEDGTNFGTSSAEAAASDTAVTFDSPTNLLGPIPISCPASGVTYKHTIASVASIFGGVLPKKWGVAIKNYTGQAFTATASDYVLSYTGIKFDIA